MAEERSAEPNEATRRSEDPDYRHLWAMSFRELAEIEKDPTHPLHDKAMVVAREVSEPIRSAVQASTAPLVKQFSQSLGDWAKRAVGVSLIGLPDSVSPLTSPSLARDQIPPIEAKFGGSGRMGVDIGSDEEPDASVAEVQDAMQIAANGLLEQLVGIQAKQLEHQQLEALKGEGRERTNRRILWGTLAVAALTLIATVTLGLPTFVENIAP